MQNTRFGKKNKIAYNVIVEKQNLVLEIVCFYDTPPTDTYTYVVQIGESIPEIKGSKTIEDDKFNRIFVRVPLTEVEKKCGKDCKLIVTITNMKDGEELSQVIGESTIDISSLLNIVKKHFQGKAQSLEEIEKYIQLVYKKVLQSLNDEENMRIAKSRLEELFEIEENIKNELLGQTFVEKLLGDTRTHKHLKVSADRQRHVFQVHGDYIPLQQVHKFCGSSNFFSNV